MAVKRYNGTSWVVEAGSQGITYSATAPTTPAQGDIWVSTADINTFDSLVQTGNRNVLINGNMDIAQRGTTGGGSYAADRWYSGSGSGGIAGGQANTATFGAPPSGAYYTIYQANSSSGTAVFEQAIESATVRNLRGKTMTFSYYAYVTSGAGPAVNPLVYYSNSTDARASVTTAITPTSSTVPTGTTSWVRAIATFVVPTDAVGLKVVASIPSIASQATYVTGAQLEVGSAATPFEQRPYGQELALCQQYYQVLGNVRGTLARTGGSIKGYNVFFPVAMRVPPTPTSVNPITFDYITTTNMSGYTTNSADTVEQSSGAITLTAEL